MSVPLRPLTKGQHRRLIFFFIRLEGSVIREQREECTPRWERTKITLGIEARGEAVHESSERSNQRGN
jgi:hypothetical protein